MSRIITQLKCGKCGSIAQTYISFGHPKKDFEYKWCCEKCNECNTETIEALPYSSTNFYDIFKKCATCHYNTPYMCGLEYDTIKGVAYCSDAEGETVPIDIAEEKSNIAVKKYIEYEQSFEVEK